MATHLDTDWVRSVELPFRNHQAHCSDDWYSVASQLHSIVPLRNFQPLKPETPFLQRGNQISLGRHRVASHCHTGTWVQGERTLPGVANLRFALQGKIRIDQSGQSRLLMSPGRLMFDYDDNSSYEARTDSRLLLVLMRLDPMAIAEAGAALVGPGEDPEPFLKRLPRQKLFTEDNRTTGIVLRQMLRILNVAETCHPQPSPTADGALAARQAKDEAQLETLMNRSLALLLYPEFLKNH